MNIELPDHLKVQGYGHRKKGGQYVRVDIPVATSDECDIQPKDLILIKIVDHIKVRKKK